jgi:hypothetical protein
MPGSMRVRPMRSCRAQSDEGTLGRGHRAERTHPGRRRRRVVAVVDGQPTRSLRWMQRHLGAVGEDADDVAVERRLHPLADQPAGDQVVRAGDADGRALVDPAPLAAGHRRALAQRSQNVALLDKSLGGEGSDLRVDLGVHLGHPRRPATVRLVERGGAFGRDQVGLDEPHHGLHLALRFWVRRRRGDRAEGVVRRKADQLGVEDGLAGATNAPRPRRCLLLPEMSPGNR